MAEPSEKSPEIEKFLDAMSKRAFGRSRSKSIKEDICVMCGLPATNFRDGTSRKEFGISGLCQNCQDEVFGR
jgi:hypothetical protein